MLLTARILASVADVNTFEHIDVAESVEGSQFDVYFQVVDGAAERNSVPPGRRYLPATGATLEVTISTLDSAKRVVRQASNPFPDDRSIWKLALTPADGIVGTFSLKLRLVEGTKVTQGIVPQAISIKPLREEF